MLQLDENKKSPLYEQLFWKLRNSILNGELGTNQALKPIRILAEELGISRNTVNRAYGQLVEEGYIRSIPGSGYYVEEILSLAVEAPSSHQKKPPQEASDILYDFRYESFSGELFPWKKWRRYVQDALTEESYQSCITYEVNKGNLQLRQSLCSFLQKNRGVKCTPDHIIILSGTQYAMDILADILPKRFYKIGMEEPGYDGMRQIFKNKGWQICPLPLTPDGIDANGLERSDCDLLYLTPSHQFPTGVTLSLSKRLQILQWAWRNHVTVIENDYDSAFLYGQRPLPAMQSMASHNQVVYMDTLSKILTPELRCAYLVLPDPLLKTYEAKYRHHYSTHPVYLQRALAAFIDSRLLERQARSSALLSQHKCACVQTVLHRELPPSLCRCSQTPSGTHLLVKIPGEKNQSRLMDALKARGIKIYGTESYWSDPAKADKEIYLMGFSGIPEKELEQACLCFAAALRDIKSAADKTHFL